MRRTLLGSRLLGILIISVVFCLFTVNTAGAAKVLKFQCAYVKTAGSSQTMEFLADKVKEYTKGEVELKLYWSGQLVKASEALTAIQRGMIDGYSGSVLYFAGTIPEANGHYLPYAWKNPLELLDIYYNHGFREVTREAFAKHGVLYLTTFTAAKYGLMSNFPIRKLEDLKGKKMRAVGTGARVLKEFGAAPVYMLANEAYTGLQRGTVEGNLYVYYVLQDYKLHEVTKYVIEPPLYSPGMGDIIMSLKVWNELSPEQQDAFERAAAETTLRSYLYGLVKDEYVLSEFAREKGVEVITLEPEELERFKKAAAPVYDDHAKKSPLCAKQVEILRAYAQGRGKIKSPQFLPSKARIEAMNSK